MNGHFRFFSTLSLCFLASCTWGHRRIVTHKAAPIPQKQVDASNPSTPSVLDATAIKDGRDGRPSIDPCTDFYQFSCGQWLDQTQIPADKNLAYKMGDPLDKSALATLNGILTSYAGLSQEKVPPSTYSNKLGDYYKSCMNVEDSTGNAAIEVKQTLTQIDQATDPKQFAQILAQLHLLGTDAFFGFSPSQDMNDSSRVIGFLYQGGLALPDRDYYLVDKPEFKKIKDAYVEHIAKVLTYVGVSAEDAAKRARSVLDIETRLAQISYSHDDARDPSKTNHLMKYEKLAELNSEFAWNEYFVTLGSPEITPSQDLDVMEPEFVTGLGQLFREKSPKELRDYLAWQYLRRAEGYMGGSFYREYFNFFHGILNGQKEPAPRWKFCTQQVQGSLGYALAEAYIKTFDGDAIRKKTLEYIKLIREIFETELKLLTAGPGSWLDQDTLKTALEKLNALGMKVGAPDKFLNYDELKVRPDFFLINNQNTTIFESRRQLKKIGAPVDKSEWGMMPWEVNAYYDPSNNEFVFPFGILQPPSFDLNASDGANLGSFGGGTIGHELTHGYDKDGSKFDPQGNIRDWWSKPVAETFDRKNQCYIEQANQYKIREVDLFVNGKLTITENVADQGGVKLGYLALNQLLNQRPAAPLWQGVYNERQQYWIAYAQSWCMKETPERLRNIMTSNEHPPAEFRVNAVVMNRPEFAADFGCKANSRMAPHDRCSLW